MDHHSILDVFMVEIVAFLSPGNGVAGYALQVLIFRSQMTSDFTDVS